MVLVYQMMLTFVATGETIVGFKGRGPSGVLGNSVLIGICL